MLGVGIYQTKSYTAYIYKTKLVICTPLCCFRVVPTNKNNHDTLNQLKLDILNGHINRLDDMPSSGGIVWEASNRPC